MREVKFRGWDGKRMVQPDDLVIADGEWFSGYRAFEDYAPAPKEGLMQFTGLKDSAGTEIYEGDVVYVAGYGDMVIEWPFDMLYEASREGDIGAIKGNIHENKELAK